jgi:DNA-binding response OmpR family regulator
MANSEQSGKVLVAEDPFVRSFVTTYLSRHGFTVIASDPSDAEKQLRSGLAVDLLVTNNPGQFAGIAGNIPLLYLAAFPDPREAARFRQAQMLRKPFRPEQLLTAVTALLGDSKTSG